MLGSGPALLGCMPASHVTGLLPSLVLKVSVRLKSSDAGYVVRCYVATACTREGHNGYDLLMISKSWAIQEETF